MSTWEERMAERAAERRVAAEAEDFLRDWLDPKFPGAVFGGATKPIWRPSRPVAPIAPGRWHCVQDGLTLHFFFVEDVPDSA